MTTEHENDERDERVSETYRALGVEQAPEHLNQNILRMAANDGKRGRAGKLLLSAWMKPVAWAATIGLSLAIVLEVTQLPSTDNPAIVAPDAAMPASAAVEDDFSSKEKDNADRAEEPKKLEEQLIQPTAVYEQEARGLSSSQDANGPAREGKVTRRQDYTLAPQTTTTPAAEALRTRNAEPVIDQAMGPDCDAEIRQSQDNWLSCIEDLRANGAIEQADLEYEAYILEFPAESKAE
jgi:hypothetical protein